jgi:hypothetical protein
MKHIRKFKSFLKEAAAVATSPKEKEKVKPKVPTKPQPPVKPEEPTIKPSIVPAPRKAVTEIDVVNRFIEETNEMGQSVEKYIK